jgi:hypothetical protein
MGSVGDGKYIYTAPASTVATPTDRRYYIVALESKPKHWIQYSSQVIWDGPMSMAFDRVHHLVYSSNWRAGVWKLDARHAIPQKSIPHGSAKRTVTSPPGAMDEPNGSSVKPLVRSEDRGAALSKPKTTVSMREDGQVVVVGSGHR